MIAGYYEPEWEDCWFCWPGWAPLENEGLEWFVGKVDPLRLPRAHFVLRTGAWSFSGWLLCRLGWHRDDEYGWCQRCFRTWESRGGPRP